MNKNRFASRIIAAGLVPAVLFLTTFLAPTAIAGDAVPWNDLPKKIGRGKMRRDNREDREYRVVTKDGLIHTGYELRFSPTDVRLGTSGTGIPRDQIAEIRVHRDGSLVDAIFAPARRFVPGGHDDWDIRPLLFLPLLVPIILGVTAATAPVVLPVQGIKRLLPDRVVRVAP